MLVTDLAIPDGIDSIDEWVFVNTTNLTSILIPTTVTSINAMAFSGCTSLGNINVADGNTTYYSENNCVIETATKAVVIGGNTGVLPDNITSIGSYAFAARKQLTDVVIPDSIISIGERAFEASGLTSVTIGEGVTSIGDEAFKSCKNLTNINYNAVSATILTDTSSSSTSFRAFGDAGTNGSGITVNIGANVTTIPDHLFRSHYSNSYPPKVTKVIFSENSKCTRIGQYAFDHCKYLTEIVIPSSVTDIGYNAFNGSGLTSVTIGEGVTSIGDYAFYYCRNLTSITIPENVTSIGYKAFCYCTSVTEVNFNAVAMNSLTSGNFVFSLVGRDTTGFTAKIGNKVRYIPAYLFSPNYLASDKHNLVKVTFDNNSVCSSIGDYAFGGCDACKVFDLSTLTAIPVLSGTAFNSTSSDKQIIVPESLYDSWIYSDGWNSLKNNITTHSRLYSIYGGTVMSSITDDRNCIATATPEEGYTFNGWYENCTLTPTGQTTELVASKIEEAAYGFVLNDAGYYVSTNKGVHSSAAYCRFNFTIEPGDSLLIEYITSSESYDRSWLGKLDTPLFNNSVGATQLAMTSTASTRTIQNLTPGDHYIDFMYRKDSSGSSSNDTLQVKVTKVANSIEFTNLISTDNPYIVRNIDEFVHGSSPIQLYAKFEEIQTDE